MANNCFLRLLNIDFANIIFVRSISGNNINQLQFEIKKTEEL